MIGSNVANHIEMGIEMVSTFFAFDSGGVDEFQWTNL